jgi:hypothetical protein
VSAGRIASQDGELEAAQCGAGFHAQFPGEMGVDPAVLHEGFGAPPGPVERFDEQGGEPLVPGMGIDGPAGLGDHLAVASQAQFAVEDLLHGEQALLGEARHLIAVEFVGLDVAEERFLPQPERCLGQAQGGLGVVAGGRLGEQAAEVEQVEGVGVGVEPVATGHRLDGVICDAVLGEEAAQSQDAGVQRGLAAGGWPAPPDHALQ